MPTALITGCSSGFGEGTALGLARKGYTVYAGVRDKQRAANLAKITQDEKLDIHIVEFDVRDAPAISKIVADIESKTPIDLLVNNAGRHLICPAELAKIEDAMTVYDINVMGPLRMCQAVLPYMRKRRAGRIVNITSGGSFVAVPHMAMYIASKHALDGMSACMANELKPFNVQLVTVAPGAFKTAMMDLGILPKETYSYSRYAKRQCEQHIIDVEQGPDPAPVIEAVVQSCTEERPPLRRLAGDAVQVLKPVTDLHDSYQAWFAPLEGEVPE